MFESLILFFLPGRRSSSIGQDGASSSILDGGGSVSFKSILGQLKPHHRLWEVASGACGKAERVSFLNILFRSGRSKRLSCRVCGKILILSATKYRFQAFF